MSVNHSEKTSPATPYPFSYRLPEAVDLHGSLEVFRRPGDDLLDRWEGAWLTRTAPAGGRFYPYIVETPAAGQHREVEVVAVDPSAAPAIRGVLARLFSTSTDDFNRLVSEDPVIGRLNVAHRGIRPVLQHDLLTALVRSISAQQINLRWAATIRARLARRYGGRHDIADTFVYSLNPETLAAASASDIRELQFTTRKAESIVLLAQAFTDGRISQEDLAMASDDEVIATLTALRGIGLWSAEWILCRTLGRPRVVAGDLGVRKAVGHAYLNGAMPSESEVRSLTAHWGESAAIAQALVLHAYALGAT